MAACPRCGYGNPDVAEYCENPDCRADLRPFPGSTRPEPRDDPPPRPVVTDPGPQPDPRPRPAVHTTPPPLPRRRTPQQTPQPTASTSGPYPAATPAPSGDGPQPQKPGLTITAEPLELRAEPGGPPVSTTVTVRNKGSRVEHFTLTVNGLLAPYARTDPPQLEIFPGDEQSAQVSFAVPRAPQPAAGRVPFQIAAHARVATDVHGRVPGALTIGRFDEISARLEPEMTRGRAPGHHLVTVVNKGNGPLNVQVALADQQGELSFSPSRFAGTLTPGMTATQDVEVSAPVKWFGRIQVVPFTGTVTTDMPAATTPPLQGRRRQVPRFPWWIPATALAIVVATLALIGPLSKLLTPKVPLVDGRSFEEAAQILNDKGYRNLFKTTTSSDQPAGIVVGTKPEGNQPQAHSKLVVVQVSRGRCEGPCPVEIPVLEGRTMEEASTILTAAGFTNFRPNPVSVTDPLQDGKVIATNPPGGTAKPLGQEIVVNVGRAQPTSAPSPAASAAGSGVNVPVPVPVNPAPSAAGGNQAQASPTPPPTQPAKPAPVDLVGLAPKATWVDQSGTPLTVDPRPGLPSPVWIEPPAAPGGPAAVGVAPSAGGTITGTYRLPAATVDGDHLRAQVELPEPAPGPVTVTVLVAGVAVGNPVEVPAGLLRSRTADLDLPIPAGTTAIDVRAAGVTGTPQDNIVLLRGLRVEAAG